MSAPAFGVTKFLIVKEWVYVWWLVGNSTR